MCRRAPREDKKEFSENREFYENCKNYENYENLRFSYNFRKIRISCRALLKILFEVLRSFSNNFAVFAHILWEGSILDAPLILKYKKH